MSHYLFVIFLAGTFFVRIPLNIIFILLKGFIPFIKNRLNFERLNFSKLASISFKKEEIKADYCFEVASEGELEQVRPLLFMLLNNNLRLEILYASPSVEEKVQAISNAFPNLVRVLRLPLMSFFPFDFLYFKSVWNWVSAPQIIICRYDFYPELLLFKLFNKKLILFSGAYSKKINWYKRQAYEFFDWVVASNDVEKELFVTNILHFQNESVFSYDFRTIRIEERIRNRVETLKSYSQVNTYIQQLEKIPRSNRFILGSVWPTDLDFLKNPQIIKLLKDKKIHLLIAPHSLKSTDVLSMQEFLKNIDEDILCTDLTKNGPHIELAFDKAEIIFLNMSGILCELYSYFDHAYVGGGFGKSVHSLLEPFLSGAMVSCGPKIQRSTEYDIIKNAAPDEIELLNDDRSFYNYIDRNMVKVPNIEIRKKIMNSGKAELELIFKKMGI